MLLRMGCNADKAVTKGRLLSWPKSMEENGYASMTIMNYETA